MSLVMFTTATGETLDIDYSGGADRLKLTIRGEGRVSIRLSQEHQIALIATLLVQLADRHAGDGAGVPNSVTVIGLIPGMKEAINRAAKCL